MPPYRAGSNDAPQRRGSTTELEATIDEIEPHGTLFVAPPREASRKLQDACAEMALALASSGSTCT